MARFGAMAVAGVVSLVLAKVLLGVLIPLVGVAVGLFVLVMKFGLFALVAYFLYRLFKGRSRDSDSSI